MKRSVLSALAVFSVAAPLLLVTAPASAATVAMPYDFDGNGYPDLAVGAPGLRINAVRNAGGVITLPASATGLSHTEKIISQSSLGVPGGSETGDRFGYAVTSADFNRDGYADLAVGHPGEAIGAVEQAGSVTVIYGSNKGPDTTTSVGIAQPGGAVASAEWGYALAVGDFNVDGYPDLAVGAPGDDPEDIDEEEFLPSGTVRILPGSAGGISTAGVRVFRRQLPDANVSGFDIRFGEALAAGDLDGDRDTDLVVGSHGYEYVPDARDGSVSYCAALPGGPS
ncbi:MAG TPA: FG-GAP repeat protein, partial [Microlunatus sp.]|nr:FG-GAP repeat protein [Microlunatus sp.]